MNLKLAAVAALLIATFTPPVLAKHWTVTERQNALKYVIDRGEHRGDLTFREAKSLRKQCRSILTKEAKMKAKNNGKISVADRTKLEHSLNKLSERAQRLQLAKRAE